MLKPEHLPASMGLNSYERKQCKNINGRTTTHVLATQDKLHVATACRGNIAHVQTTRVPIAMTFQKQMYHCKSSGQLP